MNSFLFSALAGLVLASANAGPSDEMYEELRLLPPGPAAESLAEDIIHKIPQKSYTKKLEIQ